MNKVTFTIWSIFIPIILLFILLYLIICLLAAFSSLFLALFRPFGSGSRRPLNADPVPKHCLKHLYYRLYQYMGNWNRKRIACSALRFTIHCDLYFLIITFNTFFLSYIELMKSTNILTVWWQRTCPFPWAWTWPLGAEQAREIQKRWKDKSPG
jgi:hypothetical protein